MTFRQFGGFALLAAGLWVIYRSAFLVGFVPTAFIVTSTVLVSVGISRLTAGR